MLILMMGMIIFLSFIIIQKILYRFDDYVVISNLQGFDDNKWSINGIEKSIEGFVDAGELEHVSKAIFDFINNAKKHSMECATTYDCDFNPISKFIRGNSNRYVDIPLEDIDMVAGSYFGLVGHSHTRSKIPLPNWHDIETGIINLNIKYNIIYAPGFGVTIIKKSNPTIKLDIGRLENSFNKSHSKRKDYVQNNITKEIEEYKLKVKYDYSISDFKKLKEMNKIEDWVRHKNLKEQCTFYNDELKQYDIELLYFVA